MHIGFCLSKLIVFIHFDRIMAQAVKQNLEDWKVKLDSFLHEDNCIAHGLEKIESKTGVKRLHIAFGESACRVRRNNEKLKTMSICSHDPMSK